MILPVIGVDIGGTKIAVTLLEGETDGATLMTASTPRDPEGIVALVLDLARRVSEGATVAGIGVGSAGTFDASGVVVHSTDLILGWTGMPLARRLSESLGVPAVAINDVHAAALAESRLGAGREADRLLVVTVGTGVGGAFVRSGVVDAGCTGSACSVGHLPLRGVDRPCSCGAIGHVEPIASGPGIERTFVELGRAPLGLRAIADAARNGDAIAVAAIDDGGRALGRALASAATLLDPDLIVVGGGVAELGDLLLRPVIEAYRESALAANRDVSIVRAELGVSATAIGGGIAIRDALG